MKKTLLKIICFSIMYFIFNSSKILAIDEATERSRHFYIFLNRDSINSIIIFNNGKSFTLSNNIDTLNKLAKNKIWIERKNQFFNYCADLHDTLNKRFKLGFDNKKKVFNIASLNNLLHRNYSSIDSVFNGRGYFLTLENQFPPFNPFQFESIEKWHQKIRFDSIGIEIKERMSIIYKDVDAVKISLKNIGENVGCLLVFSPDINVTSNIQNDTLSIFIERKSEKYDVSEISFKLLLYHHKYTDLNKKIIFKVQLKKISFFDTFSDIFGALIIIIFVFHIIHIINNRKEFSFIKQIDKKISVNEANESFIRELANIIGQSRESKKENVNIQQTNTKQMNKKTSKENIQNNKEDIDIDTMRDRIKKEITEIITYINSLRTDPFIEEHQKDKTEQVNKNIFEKLTIIIDNYKGIYQYTSNWKIPFKKTPLENIKSIYDEYSNLEKKINIIKTYFEAMMDDKTKINGIFENENTLQEFVNFLSTKNIFEEYRSKFIKDSCSRIQSLAETIKSEYKDIIIGDLSDMFLNAKEVVEKIKPPELYLKYETEEAKDKWLTSSTYFKDPLDKFFAFYWAILMEYKLLENTDENDKFTKYYECAIDCHAILSILYNLAVLSDYYYFPIYPGIPVNTKYMLSTTENIIKKNEFNDSSANNNMTGVCSINKFLPFGYKSKNNKNINKIKYYKP